MVKRFAVFYTVLVSVWFFCIPHFPFLQKMTKLSMVTEQRQVGRIFHSIFHRYIKTHRISVFLTVLQV